MSTPPSPHPAHPSPAPAPAPADRQIRIYSHSALFYWWPVWAVGFLMAILTLVDDQRLAIVPGKTEAIRHATVEGTRENKESFKVEDRDVLILDKGKHLIPDKPDTKGGDLPPPISPYLVMARSKNYGVLWATVLLVIIVVSNVPLRGLWSLLIVLSILVMSLVFALIRFEDRTLWEIIFERLHYLDVHINAGGYIFICLVLFIIWAATVFFFDHRTYVMVSPGQVRVCMAVGAGETVYDTTGMTFQKRQDDLFRHWIVGLGSGDLIIHRTNTNQEIDLPNVLFIGAKVKEIEKLMKEREVV